VIGIGCRFPGGVDSPTAFWRLLAGGVDAIGPMPPGRYDATPFLHSEPRTPGKLVTTDGGYIADVDRFDAAFFGMSPREAEKLDPQHRLLLEVAWEALEDAGIPAPSVAGSPTGVFAGIWLQDYETRLFRDASRVDFYDTTGTGRYAASGRISHALGLQGPAITFDTACSSSLVAIHQACRSLQSGDCTLALAGGANVILQPHITLAYSRSGMMAPDARCKFGDARANGYVRSDGAGMVALKLLDRAIEDGDPIYAVVLGGAVNNDGRSGEHFVTPARAGQEEMLRLAWADAGVSPSSAVYVEAHGTGTAAGDPVELGAIGAVLGAGRAPGDVCLVGSVKTNFGHTEGAAGVAGFIKTALILDRGVVPESLHFDTPSPAIPWDELHVRIPAASTPLPARGAAALAGVSSFGIAGTNAHVVLAAPPVGAQAERAQGATSARGAGRAAGSPTLLPLSAHDPRALREAAGRLVERIGGDEDIDLGDLAFTLGTRRTHHTHRVAFVTESTPSLVAALREYAAGRRAAESTSETREVSGPVHVAFVFPGQGSQWTGMGRRLAASEPVFAEALRECEEAMRPFVDWSLAEQLALSERDAGYRLDSIDVIQPVLVALDISLARLWESWGVRPTAVVGHSLGEVAAAHVAGILRLEDAMRIICGRSKLMLRIRGRGGMAVVELPAGDAEAALAEWGGRLSVAASNSPRSTVVAGEGAALDELVARLEARGVFGRRVAVDVASHSPQVDELKEDLLRVLGGVRPGRASIPFVSTVDVRVLEGPEMTPEYWVRNLRQQVRFADAVQKIAADSVAAGSRPVFLEVSPHPVLVPAIAQASDEARASAFGSLRRDLDEPHEIRMAAAELWASGVPLDFERLAERGRALRLPPYPWQRDRFWVDEDARATSGRPGGHPILGTGLDSASGVRVREGRISLEDFPFLADHRVGGRTVMPAAALVELALSAAPGASEEIVLEDVRFEEMLELRKGSTTGVQLTVSRESEQSWSFELHGDSGEGGWVRCAKGRMIAAEALGRPRLPEAAPDMVPAPDHYGAMARRGLDYGPAFQGVRQIRLGGRSAVAEVELPSAAGSGVGLLAHPSILDAVLQVALRVATDGSAPQDTPVPTAIRRLRLHRRRGLGARGTVRASSGSAWVADVALESENGAASLSIEGARFQSLSAARTDIAGLLFDVAWTPSPAPPPGRLAQGRWLVVGESELARDLCEALERQGGEASVVPSSATVEEVQAWLEQGDSTTPSAVAFLSALDEDLDTTSADVHAIEAAQRRGVEALLEIGRPLLEHDASRSLALRIVTRDSVRARHGDGVGGLAHAPLWGMGAVLAQEHPRIAVRMVDADRASGADALARELAVDDDEDRVALRGGERLAARLVAAEAASGRGEGMREAPPSYRLETTRPGVLDALELRARPRDVPGPGEVEIEVRVAAMNFLGVLSALGAYPGFPRGLGPLCIECAGVIASVGPGVSRWRVGDRVAAFAHHSMGAHVVVSEDLLVGIPGGVGFEDAATVPIAYLTAHYALEHLARLGKGERVLVHAATGGVGLAAIELARNLGAEVLATAGSPEKRAWLRERGVAHVFDSRSLAFADDVLAATGGEGVDVVLNSLPGEAVAKGLEILRPYGRFVELSKRDIYDEARVGLAPFRRNLSYFAVDLERAARERPALLADMLRTLERRLAAKEISPLPWTVVDVTAVADAFRDMASARHTGKLLVHTPRPEEIADRLVTRDVILPADATYLISGGLGALGLLVAEWLTERGARHLVLLGRGRPSPEVQQRLAALGRRGASVRVEQVDVADEAAVRAVVTRIRQELPPLRGVVHAAGVLADATLATLDADGLRTAMRPKVSGAWALHRATEEARLDFFVLFSSVAGVLGTTGQANYAAGNAFLDALAGHRVAHGLTATSIAWGPWSDVGLAAARDDRGARLAAQGLGSLPPDEGIGVLAALMHDVPTTRTVARLDVELWRRSHATAARVPFLSRLGETARSRDGAEPAGSAILDELRSAPSPAERAARLRAHLKQRLSEVLRLPTERVQVATPFKRLGMDSLMALELRNRLEPDLGVPVSATSIWNYPTVELLAKRLLERLDGLNDVGQAASGSASRSEQVSAVPSARAPKASDEPDASLSDLLDRELAAIDELLGDG